MFASNRQTKSKTNQATGTVYLGLDEYERERVLNLHTMDKDGGAITQISFNQSHERNPVLRPNGDIMFSRWEHVGPRNRFAIFRTKPDGTDMFVLYGAQSPGNSFLHPRDMDPAGKYAGFVSSSLMSLSGTQEGGSLMFIDAASYSEHNTPANSTVPAAGGQAEVTDKPLNQGRGLSMFGRITSPYPLWDGSDRVLLGFRPCEVTRDGVVIPCVNLTADEIARLEDDNMTREQRAADSVQDNVPASYAIYMYDPGPQTWLIVAAPPPGFMHTDPVALQARPEPAVIEPAAVDAALAARGMALIEVRSVYDTDGLNRMGENMLAAVDLPAGCCGRHRQADAARCDGHPRRDRRPGADEGPGRCRLRLLAGALRPRHPRRLAAVERDGRTRGDRRDRVRAAADPRLRADRARRLVQAGRAGRRAARLLGPRRQGPQHPDPPQLDPGAAGRAPHLRRLPQPAPRRGDQLRHRRQHRAGGGHADPRRRAPVGRDDGGAAHPPRSRPRST